jgi:hypothetical protein
MLGIQIAGFTTVLAEDYSVLVFAESISYKLAIDWGIVCH